MKQIIEITFKGETKQVKFTEPQALIMNRLLNGEKVTLIHEHRMNGGDFVWYEERFEENCFWGAEFVGYKAFWGAIRTIAKAFCGERWYCELEGEIANQYFV